MLKYITDILYYWYISNPILNPSVVRITPITFNDIDNREITRYHALTRKHCLDKWVSLGSFSNFTDAMNEVLK